MATVKYGSIITEIRGSLQGHTFQKIGSSLSMRTNPRKSSNTSSNGAARRSTLSLLSNHWISLTPSQKQSFSDYAFTYPTRDKYNNPVVLSAYQLFMYIAFKRYMFDNTLITVCYPFSNPTGFIASIGTVNLTSNQALVWCPDPVPVNTFLMIYTTVPSFSLNKAVKGKQYFTANYGIPLVNNANLFSYINQKFDGTQKNLMRMCINIIAINTINNCSGSVLSSYPQLIT
jgi:hypothetical protein